MKRFYLLLTIALFYGCSGNTPQPPSNTAAQSAVSSGADCSDGIDCENKGLEYVSSGEEPGYRKARAYFEKACQLGESEGCNNLAFLNANGRGGEQSYTLAYRYWKKACDMGNQLGCTNLGLAKEKVAAMHADQGKK